MRVRRILVGLAGAGAAVILSAGTAWACTNLATLNLSSAAGQVGENVTVTGSSFAKAPVVLHWNAVNGPVLATVTPDQTGSISAPITIPAAQPGYYVLVATEMSHGQNAYGTPARAAFQVLAPGQRALLTPNAAQTAGVASSSPSSTGIVALTVALGVVGLALFGAGVAAFARQTRRRGVPATQPVKRG